MRYSTTAKIQLMSLKKNSPVKMSVSLRDSTLESPDCYLEALETEQDKFSTLSAK